MVSKKSSSGSAPPTSDGTSQALITVSVHNRISWNPGYLTRSSQHTVLSCQTLGDLFNAIPCTSNELPDEIIDDERVVGYENIQLTNSKGCVMCIEGIAYGDGQSETDYAEFVFTWDVGLHY